MAAVVFEFGHRPGISETDALELAELLSRRRNLAAQSIAGKIHAQARRNPDAGEASDDVDLEPTEREELLALLEQPSSEPESDAVRNLRRELRDVLGRHRRVVIAAAGLEHPIEDDDLDRLIVELERIGRLNLPDAEQEPELATTLQLLGTRGSYQTFEPTDHERALFARALDHIRNAGNCPASLIQLRDRIIGAANVKGTAYALVRTDGTELGIFYGYSVPYAAGDRLVAGEDAEFRVTRVGPQLPDGTVQLAVESWLGPI